MDQVLFKNLKYLTLLEENISVERILGWKSREEHRGVMHKEKALPLHLRVAVRFNLKFPWLTQKLEASYSKLQLYDIESRTLKLCSE